MSQDSGQAYEDTDETSEVEEAKSHPGDQAFEDPEKTKEWEDDK